MNWPPAHAVVVDAAAGQAAVWSVTTGCLGMSRESRLAGAWLIPESDVPQLHVWRSGTAVLATTRALHVVPVEFGSPGLRIEPKLLIVALQRWIAALDEAFSNEQSTRQKSKQLEPPKWPHLLASSAVISAPSDADDPTAVALGNARWLARLCEDWAAVQEQRDMRPFLKSVQSDG